jgi:hypothetical protein
MKVKKKKMNVRHERVHGTCAVVFVCIPVRCKYLLDKDAQHVKRRLNDKVNKA